jgi:hypothetical protein
VTAVAELPDVTAVEARPRRPRVPRMSLSSMCRDRKHKTCQQLRMRCACECHAKDDAGEPEVAPAVDKKLPVVDLVRADPPAPPAPKRKPSLAEQVRPFLELLLVEGDRDWYRVVLFHKARQAAMNIKRIRESHSKADWEWRAVKLDEVDQSAIYVRWVGKERTTL